MAFLMLGAGLQGTHVGVRATLEGFPTFVTGTVMAFYYLGYVVGSIGTPPLVQRVGHVRVFAALTSAASVTILIQALFVEPLSWALLRAVSGCCFAGIYVVAESWLNDRGDNRTRGALLAVYMIVIYLGLGLGQFLLNVGDPRSTSLFILVAVLISAAVMPIALTAQRAPDFALPERVRVRELARTSPLGVAGVLASGATGGTVFALGPVYASDAGFSTVGISAFMALNIFAAVAVQLPLGRLSDRLDRRNVLAAMSVVAAVAAGAAWLLVGISLPIFFVMAAVTSGLSLSIYSLAVSHVNDHLQPAQMVAASGTLILVNGAGAMLAPLVIAAAMQLRGENAYFVSLAIIHFAFAAYALWRKRRRGPIPAEEKSAFVALQPQAVPTGRLTAEAATRSGSSAAR
jgi:MFS family permease